jgi:hypothetical protein
MNGPSWEARIESAVKRTGAYRFLAQYVAPPFWKYFWWWLALAYAGLCRSLKLLRLVAGAIVLWWVRSVANAETKQERWNLLIPAVIVAALAAFVAYVAAPL